MADILATFVLGLYDFPPFGLRGQWHFSRPDTQPKVHLKQCRLTNLCEFSRKCPKHKVCEDLASAQIYQSLYHSKMCLPHIAVKMRCVISID